MRKDHCPFGLFNSSYLFLQFTKHSRSLEAEKKKRSYTPDISVIICESYLNLAHSKHIIGIFLSTFYSPHKLFSISIYLCILSSNVGEQQKHELLKIAEFNSIFLIIFMLCILNPCHCFVSEIYTLIPLCQGKKVSVTVRANATAVNHEIEG